MNNITLTNEDHEPTLSFAYGDCGISRVYLNGLQEGELLLSERPFLLQNTNGIIAGIDQRFSTLKVVKNNTVLQTLQLEWSNSCNETTQIATISVKTPLSPKSLINSFGIPTLLVILSVTFAFIVFRARK